jgi:hypothetical protein
MEITVRESEMAEGWSKRQGRAVVNGQKTGWQYRGPVICILLCPLRSTWLDSDLQLTPT